MTSCGGGVERVSPTPRSEFRSTYPCQLLTRAMAERLLHLHGLRRAAAQSFDDGTEQCLWAPSKYSWTPALSLVVYPNSKDGDPRGFARLQRGEAKAFAMVQRGRAALHQKPVVGGAYRVLRGIGERAFLSSYGRQDARVAVQQRGRSFTLMLRLKLKPRSQPPPLDELEALARDISARFDPPPVKLRGRLRDIERSS